MKRLLAEDLTNKQYEIEDLYSNVNEEISQIRNSLEDTETYIGEFNLGESDYYSNTIFDEVTNINNAADNIHDFIGDAKDTGILNEDQLNEGNKIIEGLEDELKSLQEELEDIESNHSEYQNEIDHLEEKISETQILLDQLLDNNNEASLNSKLKPILAASHVFICSIHDSIMNAANDIQYETSTIENLVKDLINASQDSLPSIISEVQNGFGQVKGNIEQSLNSIENDMSTGLDMNNRMGRGIDRKNDTISDIKSNIEDIKQELEQAGYTTDELQSIMNDLEHQLGQLESQL